MIPELQRALTAKGFIPGPIDGKAGPSTWGALFAYMAGKASPATAALGAGAAADFHKYGIDGNRLRLAHFMAEAATESGGFRRFEENLYYSAKRLCEVWPSRFPTLAQANRCANSPETLAERVYGGRMGNNEPGDGYRFRGRGIIQLTGRASYGQAEAMTGLPLIAQPDLAAQPASAVRIMCAYWDAHYLNRKADADDLAGIRKAINGGLNGLETARQYLAQAKGVL